jgi:branched-chain amino acid transport system substrate-binding protein
LGAGADGFIGPSQWEPAVSVANPDFGPTGVQAVNLLQSAADTRGLPVDYPMAQAFAAGLVAERCIQEAGNIDESALREAAGALDFTTFYGRFRIDEAGRQVGREVALVQRQHGDKVVVWPPESADGELVYPWR